LAVDIAKALNHPEKVMLVKHNVVVELLGYGPAQACNYQT